MKRSPYFPAALDEVLAKSRRSDANKRAFQHRKELYGPSGRKPKSTEG